MKDTCYSTKNIDGNTISVLTIAGKSIKILLGIIMASKKFCCDKLKGLHDIKEYMSGKETKIPALADKKHLMCIMADNVYSTCPAYFEIAFCPCCGKELK